METRTNKRHDIVNCYEAEAETANRRLLVVIVFLALLLFSFMIGTAWQVRRFAATTDVLTALSKRVTEDNAQLNQRVATLEEDVKIATLHTLQTKYVLTQKDKRVMGISQIAQFAMKTNSELTAEEVNRISELIYDIATKYERDPLKIAAQVWRESEYNPQAVGREGEIGLMQIMPSNGRFLARIMGYDDFNIDQLYKPEVNIEFGVYYLVFCTDIAFTYVKDEVEAEELGLTGYNRGHNKLERLLVAGENPRNGYEEQVLNMYKRLAGGEV